MCGNLKLFASGNRAFDAFCVSEFEIKVSRELKSSDKSQKVLKLFKVFNLLLN